MELPDIKNSKIGIIYVYYERKNQQKNQTNLTFFIKYGLNDKLWLNLNIETLFVINGNYTELIIPSKPSINLLPQDNCSDWEGWYNGIKFYENKYNKPIWEIFDYLCLINAGAFGPVYEENINDHWLLPFYNKMVKHNSILCSPCMSFLPKTNLSGEGPRVVPIFSLIRCSKKIVELLMNTDITLCDKSTTHKDKHNNVNTVLGKKVNKNDAACSGEYGISRILLENGYNICSLLYDFDCNDSSNWSINGNIEPDRYNSFNGENIPLTTIFIKNLWRSECGSYVSIPVLYNECKNYFYQKLNMNSIFNNINSNHNFDLMQINDIDVSKGYWNSKKEYYLKFGYAEENIIFNKPSEKLNGCLIYAHYDSNNIVRDYVIQTIQTFRYLGYDILFFTACEKLINVSVLPCKVFYTSNNGAGTDWKIWFLGCEYLIKNNIKYNYIFLLNDSIILPVNGINNFKNTIIDMRKNSDFWGHWESNEIEWHIIGTPIEFKYKMINVVASFIKQRLLKCVTKMDFITKIEVKFAKYLCNKGYKHNTVIKKTILNNNVVCPVFNPVNLYKWINNPSTFAIKWKYSLSYLNKNNVSKELNYLTKYLYYGKYGVISEGEKTGVFPPSVDC
jgi:hypothetical protein